MMNLANSDLLDIAWAQCWQISLLIVSVLLIIRLIARNRPHLAHVLWLLVLVKCITPPILTSPAGVFCWLQPTQELETASVGDDVSIEIGEIGEIGELGTLPAIGSAVDLDSSSLAAQTLIGEPSVTYNILDRVIWSLFSVWMLGAAIAAFVAFWKWRSCIRRIAESAAIENEELERLVAQLSQRLGLRLRVSVLVTTSQLGPAVIGLLRPTLLLPESIVNEKDINALRPIVAHELSHVRRGDLWVGMLQLVVKSVWWFHPLVWWVGRLISREAERSCDEEVIAELECEPAVYASSLLDVLQLKNSLKAVPAFPGLKPVEVTSQRLERIMKLRQGSRKRTPWTYWLIVAVIAAIVLPGGAFVAAKGKRKRKNQDRAKPAQVKQEEKSASPTTTKKYRVDDIVQRLQKDADLTNEEAKKELEGWLMPIGQADSPLPECSWRRELLVVQNTETGHLEFSKSIKRLREFGFLQVTISSHVLTGDIDMQKLQKQFAQANAETAAGFLLLDDNELFTFMSEFSGEPRNNSMTFPKITLFNGQKANITDAMQRPFIIAVEELKNGGSKPQIEVAEAGTTLELEATVAPDDNVQLGFSVNISAIKRIEITHIHRPNGRLVELEIPTIDSRAMNSTVLIPLNKSIVVFGGTRRQGDRTQSIAAVFTPRIINTHEKNPPRHRDAISELIEAGKHANAPFNQLRKIEKQESSAVRAIERALEYLRRYSGDSEESKTTGKSTGNSEVKTWRALPTSPKQPVPKNPVPVEPTSKTTDSDTSVVDRNSVYLKSKRDAEAIYRKKILDRLKKYEGLVVQVNFDLRPDHPLDGEPMFAVTGAQAAISVPSSLYLKIWKEEFDKSKQTKVGSAPSAVELLEIKKRVAFDISQTATVILPHNSEPYPNVGVYTHDEISQ